MQCFLFQFVDGMQIWSKDTWLSYNLRLNQNINIEEKDNCF